VTSSLVIPAAGSGARLGRSVPKALVELAGVPLLVRTLERLACSAKFVETVVLAPAASIDALSEVVDRVADAQARALGSVRVVAGGATRQQSVAIGIAALRERSAVVCVHDAARPFVAPATVRAVLGAARAHGAATAASRPSDSVRIDEAGGSSAALERSRLWLVETPQAFTRELLERAHAEAAREGREFTDDASLVEAAGATIRVVASEGRNIKVTVEADLVLGEELLRRQAG